MPSRLAAGGALLLTLALGACGSAYERDDRTVTVTTEPPGAVCTLKRGGVTVATAAPTPTRVSVEKSARNIVVSCRRDGHVDGVGVLPSLATEKPPNTLTIGAIVTVTVDISAGMEHDYPRRITIVLTPRSFSTAAEREAFFARRRARIERDAETAAAVMRRACDPESQDCAALATIVERASGTALRMLERQRAATRIDAGG